MKPELEQYVLRRGRENRAVFDGHLSIGKGRFESELERRERVLRVELERREATRDEKENGAISDGQLYGERFESEVQGKVVTGKSEGLSDGPLTGGKERGFLGGKDRRGKGECVEIKDGGRLEEVVTGVASGSGRVRRATIADLDAIMDINDNIYDGTDYFPAYFYIFMHSKQYATYVYELDGKLMALRTFHFLPDADDLVTIMAIRVRPSFQGQGFGRPDRNPIMDQFQRDHPQVKRYIIQTLFKPHVQVKIHQWKLLYHWTELKYQLPHRQPLKRFASLRQHINQRTRPTRLSYPDVCDWLNRSDQLVKFLGRYVDDYIVAGAMWTSVKLDSFELRGIFTSTNVFVSYRGTKGFIPERTEEIADHEIAGVSISSLFQCKYGVNFEIQFYGDSEVDFLSHICSHMLHYVSVTQDDVRLICSLHFPLTIDSNSVRERLREELGDIFRSDYFSVTEAVQYMAPLNLSNN